MQLACLLLVLCLPSASSQEPKYRLGIVSFFRDEARFLPEWITYHRLLGVEHFWLLNNNSKDEYAKVLAPYILEGVVDIIDVTEESKRIQNWGWIQTHYLDQMVREVQNDVAWIALIDTDEFLVPLEDLWLPEFLDTLSSYPALALNWLLFGTSWIDALEEEDLLIEKMTRCAPQDIKEHSIVKLLVQPKKVVKITGPHTATYTEGEAVDVEKKSVCGKHNLANPPHTLRINHYWTRDYRFFTEVKTPRSQKMGRWFEGMKKKLRLLNKETDEAILRFVPLVREKLEEQKMLDMRTK